MSQTELIIQSAKGLIERLEGVNDEQVIRKLTIEVWSHIKEAIASEGSLNRARTTVRKMVEQTFPTSEASKPGYYYTSSGKGKDSRHEHLALWYLTTNESRWGIVGDEARQRYWGNLPELPKSESKDLVEIPTNKSSIQTEKLSTEVQPMSIKQLELNPETETIIQDALKHTGMDFSAFVAQACKYYARTIMGRAKQNDEELAAIPTKELLENSKYNTHPGRPEELVKRAIEAIRIHNGMASEKSQKWMITQSLLMQLTGSRADKIKSLIAPGGRFYQEIADFNAVTISNYDLDEKGIHLFNRKGGGRKPEDEIRMCDLVPDGI